ncbi:MAG: thioredoxin domain-containing protein [Vulcanimicrobiaceae bacterium]
MSDFHFSPRPNRAHEIAWQSWSPEAFARAAREEKPILLSISAIWCHWCHVMDESTYSDPRVIATINERFIPVRVDNDRRPDINARYNMGGWPTTAFLTDDGTTLTGATYLPPEQMLRALEQIAVFYAERRGEIANDATALKVATPTPTSTDRSFDASAAAHVVEGLLAAFDPEYGGFGDTPKFPQSDALELLLLERRAGGDPRYQEMVALTLSKMADGGTYDHVEGGFFRYSTTRDWSVPHFEKMSEDHAGLLRVLAQLYLLSPNQQLRATLLSAGGYVRGVLLDPATQLFAGSQDADEAYYALPLEERRKRDAPYVDRTSYTNWTAGLAGAFAVVSFALGEPGFATQACATLDALHARMRDSNGLLYHYVEPDGEPSVNGLLTDQVAYLRALLDTHEVTGEGRFFERAVTHADALLAHFEAPDGGCYDRCTGDAALGNLRVADRPIVENGALADTLLRLSVLTDDGTYRHAAERALRLYADTYKRAGSFVATWARAVRRSIARSCCLRIVGTPSSSRALADAALRLPSPFVAVRTIDPSEAATLQRLGLETTAVPTAYLCAGTTCSEPLRQAADLPSAYARIAEER